MLLIPAIALFTPSTYASTPVFKLLTLPESSFTLVATLDKSLVLSANLFVPSCILLAPASNFSNPCVNCLLPL